MALFAVVYSFGCPVCTRPNVGKVLFEAANAEMAFENVRMGLECEFCCALSPLLASATIFVLDATPEEISQHGTKS